MILIDTGPLVALFDPKDEHHARCRKVLKGIKEPLSTTIPVLTEAFHIVEPGSIGSDRLRDFIGRGALSVRDLDGSSLPRAFELMEAHRDHSMDLADASLVVAAAPLLRLAAEGFFTVGPGDSGDPTGNSEGDYYAAGCIDSPQPWDWSDSFADRKRSYDAAVRRLPANYFYPFSRAAATGPLFSNLGYGCLWWQRPTPAAPVVPHDQPASYPDVPTLVLVGDIDNRVPVEEVAAVAAHFPHSHLVTIPAAGHYTIEYRQCAIDLASNFIETLHPGDTSCASKPALIWPAVGRFPLTAIDAIQRSAIGFGSGVGLRGGGFQTEFDDLGNWTTTLTDAQYTNDVKVSGTIHWGTDSSIYAISADLTVTTAKTTSGTLHVDGAFLAGPTADNFVVTGTLGKKRVAALVPET